MSAGLLGDRIRLLDNPGGAPIRLEMLNGDDPNAAVNVRYHAAANSQGGSAGRLGRAGLRVDV